MSALYQELERTVHELNRQILFVREEAKRYPVAYNSDGIDPYLLKDRNGAFIMAPLVCAKAQCLAGMAALKAAKEGT